MPLPSGPQQFAVTRDQIQNARNQLRNIHQPHQAQQMQQNQSRYTLQHYTQEELNEVQVSEHQRKSKLGHIRDAVKRLMPGAYTQIDRVRQLPDAQRETELHHSRGHSFMSQGSKVLEFNMAGSGFKQFRMTHKGLKGKNCAVIPGVGEVALKKEKKIHWYTSRAKRAQYEEENARIRAHNAEVERRIREQYGDSQTVGRKQLKEVRKKDVLDAQGNVLKTRITMAGPLAAGGALNAGDYSISNLRKYMQLMAADYLTNIFREWQSDRNFSIATTPPVRILIQGHSRGGVAAAEGALLIRQWVQKNYPEFVDKVAFDLIQYDPVPGGDTASYQSTTLKDKKHKKPGLGDSANTTVVYSVHTDHSKMFTPQTVKGADRIVLTAFKHSVGLDMTDQQDSSKRLAYTNAENQEVYRGSGLNDLPPGVYIVDETNTLVRFNTYEEFEGVLSDVTKGRSSQSWRRDRISDAVKYWFDLHSGNGGAAAAPGAGGGAAT